MFGQFHRLHIPNSAFFAIHSFNSDSEKRQFKTNTILFSNPEKRSIKMSTSDPTRQVYKTLFVLKNTDGVSEELGHYTVGALSTKPGSTDISVSLDKKLLSKLEIHPDRQKRYFKIEFEGLKSPNRVTPNKALVAELYYEIGDAQVNFSYLHRIGTDYAQADEGDKLTEMCFLGSFVKIIDVVSGNLLIKAGPMFEAQEKV
ncbi:MAG: hypothetical protein MHMPM18_001223 [Marteilia pararefringens]